MKFLKNRWNAYLISIIAYIFLCGFTLNEDVLTQCEQKHPNDFIARFVCNKNIEDQKQYRKCAESEFDNIRGQFLKIDSFLDFTSPISLNALNLKINKEFNYDSSIINAKNNKNQKLIFFNLKQNCKSNLNFFVNIFQDKNGNASFMTAWRNTESDETENTPTRLFEYEWSSNNDKTKLHECAYENQISNYEFCKNAEELDLYKLGLIIKEVKDALISNSIRSYMIDILNNSTSQNEISMNISKNPSNLKSDFNSLHEQITYLINHKINAYTVDFDNEPTKFSIKLKNQDSSKVIFISAEITNNSIILVDNFSNNNSLSSTRYVYDSEKNENQIAKKSSTNYGYFLLILFSITISFLFFGALIINFYFNQKITMKNLLNFYSFGNFPNRNTEENNQNKANETTSEMHLKAKNNSENSLIQEPNSSTSDNGIIANSHASNELNVSKDDTTLEANTLKTDINNNDDSENEFASELSWLSFLAKYPMVIIYVKPSLRELFINECLWLENKIGHFPNEKEQSHILRSINPQKNNIIK